MKMYVSVSFRCAAPSECTHQVSGLMSIAGKREWSVGRERKEIHTAVKEKISPNEPIVTTRPTRGKCQFIFGNDGIYQTACTLLPLYEFQYHLLCFFLFFCYSSCL